MNWQNVDIVDFNYEKPDTFQNALKGVDILFLEDPLSRMDADKFVIPVIDAAQKAKVKYIVNLGAMGIDKSDNAMRRIEQYIEKSDIPHTFLRPNWYMQNFSTFLSDSIVNQNAISLPAANAKTSFIDIRDVAAVAAKAAIENGHQNRVLTPTGLESLDHHQVAEQLSKVSGRPIRYAAISEDDARKYMMQMGGDEANVNFMLALYAEVRSGIFAPVTQDFKTFMGHDPLTFERFARDHAKVWQKKPEAVHKA